MSSSSAGLRPRHHLGMTPEMHAVLKSLLRHDSLGTLELPLNPPEDWDGGASINTAEVAGLLREAYDHGYVHGQPAEGDGSLVHWFGLELTVPALRELGEWPPRGGEHLPGDWDNRLWGKEDRPVLAELESSPPHSNYVFAVLGEDTVDGRWRSVRRLHGAGLLGGDLQPEGLQDMRVTTAGKRALGTGHVDPLDRAHIELRRGAKAEAMTAAVEEVLAPLLRGGAQKLGIATEQNGQPVPLGAVNDQLKAAGAYSKSVRAEIAWCLALRNDTSHGRGATVSTSRIERAIEAIRELRDI